LLVCHTHFISQINDSIKFQFIIIFAQPVAGTVLAAYIAFGAKPAYLITASIMSAPSSLAYSKLFYPETEKSLTTFENIKLEKS